MRRRIGQFAVALTAISVAAVLLVHASFVRRAVLRYAVGLLEQQYGLRLEAERLDYNLATMRIGVSRLRLSAAGRQPPFLEATYVAVVVPWRVLLGEVSFEDVAVTDGLVRVRTTAAGISNLPESIPSSGEPAPLRIARLGIAPLRVDIRNELTGVALDIPSAEVHLTARDGRIDVRDATVQVGAQRTRIAQAGGDARFDGRTLQFSGVTVAADEGRMQLDGSLTVMSSAPSLDLRVSGTAAVPLLARWGMAEADAPRGTVTFNGRVQGPLDSPVLDLTAAADRLVSGDIVLSRATAHAHVTPDLLRVDTLAADIRGGHVSASLQLPLGGDDTSPAGGNAGVMRRLRADARVVLTETPTAWTPLPLPGESRLVIADGRWRLESRHRIGGVTPAVATLGGRLADEILRSTVSGQVQVADADILALLSALRQGRLVDVPADLVAGGAVHGEARISGTLSRAQVAFSAGSENLRTASVPAGGAATVTGTFDTGTGRYTFDGALTRWQPQDVPGLAGEADLRFSGTGRGVDVRATADLLARSVVWEGSEVGEVSARIDLSGDTATVVAQAPRFAASAHATVATVAPYAGMVDARVDDLDLDIVLRGIETPVPLTGRTTLTAHAEGTVDDWRRGTARLDVQTLDARAGDLPLHLVAPAVMRYAGERLVVDSFDASAGETHLSAAGDMALSGGGTRGTGPAASGIRLRFAGSVGEVARALAATGLTQVPVTGGDGPVTVQARVAGSFDAPEITADVEVGTGTVTMVDLPVVSDVHFRSHVEGGWLELRDAGARYQGAAFTADGRVPLRFFGVTVPGADTGADAGNGSLHGRVTGVTARVLQPFIDPATVEALSGSLDATVNVEAPSLDLAALRGDAQIDRLDLRIADLPVTQRTPTRIVARDGFARVEAWDWAGQGATLGIRGQMRLSDQQVAILASGDVDLRMLTPFVREAGLSTAGSLRPQLSVTGNLDNPRIDGEVRLEGGEIRLADPRVLVSELSGRAVLTRSTATITSMTGAINGGTLTATGSAEYLPDGSIDARLDTDIAGMALDYPAGLRTELNSALQLAVSRAGIPAGDPAPATADEPLLEGSLKGTVTVLHGTYREPLAVVTGLLASMRTAQALSGVEEPSVLDHLALDVHGVTDDDISVDNNYGRFRLGTDVRIIGTGSVPALAGRAELREGGEIFVGRNVYTITSGTIDFANPDVIEPNLNVQVATRAGGQDIEVTLAGTPENLGVALQSPSDPSLGQADLTSLLLTGRRLDQLASTDATVVGAQVLGNFSADVLGFAGRVVGLDTLRIGAAPAASSLVGDVSDSTTQIDPTSRLTFGKAIGSNLDVTFSQSLRNEAAQTWVVDYLPSRQINLRLVSDDSELRTYGFRHDLNLGAARRAPVAPPQRVEARITQVTLSGDLQLPEPRVRRVLSLKTGDRFDVVKWQRDRDRMMELYQTGGWLTARVMAKRDGTALAYTVVPGPKTDLIVRGVSLSPSVMTDVRRAWMDTVFDEFLKDEAAVIVRRALARDGLSQAVVTVQLTGVEVRTLAIDVMPGARAEQVAADASGAGQATPATPPVVIGAVTFDGASQFTVEQLQAAVALAPGSAAEAGVIDAARQRLLSFYRGEGFAAVTVTERGARRGADGPLDVTFAVREGARQTLGEITVEGNRAIRSDVVERAMRVVLNDPLRSTTWLQARTRVFNTGLFRRVDVVSEPMATGASSAFTPMRMRVKVEEWPALRARYGFQVAEERPEGSVQGRDLVPGLSGDLTRRTLFGRAATLGGAVEWQRRQRLGRLFVNAPSMGGLPVRSSFILERSRRDFAADTLVTDASSVAFEQRMQATPRLKMSYAYRFEQNHTYDTKPNPRDPLPFDIVIDVARLTGSVAWDTRNDPADTASGTLVSSSVEYAASAFGSDFRYVRSLSQAYHFAPWRGVVFASAARVGSVRALGGQQLIPSLRFFGGGARTVRGVGEDSLGEHDFFGDPTGGAALLVLNQEVRFPMYRWLRGVGFVDAGNVFATPAFGSGQLVKSVGVGLRLTTPFGVVRVDAGRVLSPGPGQSGGVSIGIGQAF